MCDLFPKGVPLIAKATDQICIEATLCVRPIITSNFSRQVLRDLQTRFGNTDFPRDTMQIRAYFSQFIPDSPPTYLTEQNRLVPR